jgi:hypothetical protein
MPDFELNLASGNQRFGPLRIPPLINVVKAFMTFCIFCLRSPQLMANFGRL